MVRTGKNRHATFANARRRMSSVARLTPRASGFQVLAEPIQCVLPGFLRRRLIVTRGRIVVETMIGAFVDMALVRYTGLREGGIERRPSIRDARVEFAIL